MKANQGQKKHKERLWQEKFFLLCETLRSCQLRSPIFYAIYCLTSMFYIFPFLSTIYTQLNISSGTNTVVSYIQSLISTVESFSNSQLIAFLYMAAFLLFFGTLIGLGVSLVAEEQEEEWRRKLKLAAFRVLCYLIANLRFPLSNILTYLAYNYIGENPAISVLGVVNLLALCLVSYCLEEFTVSIDFNNQMIFSKIYSRRDGLLVVLKIFISNAFVLLGSYCTYLIVPLLFALAISIFQMSEALFSIKFYHQKAQLLFTIKVFMHFVFLFEGLLLFILPGQILMNNLDLFQIALVVFISTSNYHFRKYHTSNMVICDLSAIKSENDALAYILNMIKMSLSQDYLETIRPFLVHRHFRDCKSATCFCSEFNGSQTLKLTMDTKFINAYILQNIETMRARFPKSLLVFSLYLNFKLLQNAYFSKIKQKLQQFMAIQPERTLIEQYLIFQLERMVEDQIKEISNKNGYLHLENVFKEAKIHETLKQLLAKIVQNLAEKYKKLTLEAVRISELGEYCDRINAILMQIEDLWHEYLKNNSYNIQIDLSFLFYFENVIPSYEESKKLRCLISKKIKKLIILRGVSKDNLEVLMYSHKSCLLESLLDESFCSISNASESVSTVLGISKYKIIDQSIHNIMPEYFVKGHKKKIEEWIKNETLVNENKNLAECIFVDRNHTAFSTFKYLRVFSDGSILKMYILIVRDNDNDYMVVSKQGRIEGIGKGLLKMGVLSKECLHKNINAIATKDFLFRANRAEGRETIFIKPKSRSPRMSLDMASDELFNEQDQVISHEQEEEEVVFQCKIKKKVYEIGDTEYFGVFFCEARKRTLSQPMLDCEEVNLSKRSLRSGGLLQQMSIKDKSIIDHSTSKDLMNQNMPKSKRLATFMQEQKSVQTELTESSSMKIYVSRIILNIKKLACSPDEISCKRYIGITVAMILIAVLVILGFFLMQWLFSAGFNSFNSVLSGDDAVNNNNQLLQIIYNNLLMSRVYCSNQTQSERCSYILNNNAVISNQLYSLYVSDLQVYLTNVTFLSRMKYYQSYEIPVEFIVNGQVIQMSMLYFMEYYYQAIKTVQSQTEGNEGSSLLANQAMQTIYNNWNTIETINHQAITYYQNAGSNQLQILTEYLFSLFSGIIILILVFVGVLKMYYDKTESDKSSLLRMYRNISRKNANIFYAYFDQIRTSSDNGLNVHNYPTLEPDGIHQGLINYETKKKYNYYLVAIFLTVILLISAEIIQIVNLFPPAKNMVNAINSLMHAESNHLENYIDLKTFYLNYNFNKSEQQMEAEILSNLNQTQVTFNQIAKSSIPIFATQDSIISSNFNNILIENVCNLTASYLEDWQMQYCINGTHFDILEKGVLAGMQFLQRNTMSALIELKSSSSINKTAYFMQSVFQDLDDYLFYMFWIWNLMQKSMYDGLSYSIQQSSNSLTLINCTAAIIMGAMVIYWMLNLKNEKKKVSCLYGYVLQLPQSILSKKSVLNELNEVISLSL